MSHIKWIVFILCLNLIPAHGASLDYVAEFVESDAIRGNYITLEGGYSSRISHGCLVIHSPGYGYCDYYDKLYARQDSVYEGLLPEVADTIYAGGFIGMWSADTLMISGFVRALTDTLPISPTRDIGAELDSLRAEIKELRKMIKGAI